MTRVQIPWGSLHRSSLLYGSQIQYVAENKVIFQNANLPSGIAIHQWHSSSTYYVDKKVASLPLLIPGQLYRIGLQAQSQPNHSAYLRLKFFDMSDDLIEESYLRQDSSEFTYPEQASFYQIDLLAAGLQRLEFHYLWIETTDSVMKQTNQFWSLDQELTGFGERFDDIEWQRPVRLIFLEPSHSVNQKSIHPIMIKSINGIGLSFSENQWYSDQMFEHLMKLVLFIRQHQAKLRFVGYGPYSNWLAVYYATMIEHDGLEISFDRFSWQEYANLYRQIHHHPKPDFDHIQKSYQFAHFFGYQGQTSISKQYVFSRLLDYSVNLIFMLEDEANHG